MRQLISCLVLPATSPARVPVTLLATLCGMVPLPNTILPTINIHISSLLLYVLSKYPVPGPPAPFYLILPPNQIYCILNIRTIYLPYTLIHILPYSITIILPYSTTFILNIFTILYLPYIYIAYLLIYYTILILYI